MTADTGLVSTARDKVHTTEVRGFVAFSHPSLRRLRHTLEMISADGKAGLCSEPTRLVPLLAASRQFSRCNVTTEVEDKADLYRTSAIRVGLPLTGLRRLLAGAAIQIGWAWTYKHASNRV
jgi:hypothetical protein